MKKDTTQPPTEKPVKNPTEQLQQLKEEYGLKQPELPGIPPAPQAKGLIAVKHIHDGSGKKLSKHIVTVESANDLHAYELAIKLERVLNTLERKRYDVIYKHVTI